MLIHKFNLSMELLNGFPVSSAKYHQILRFEIKIGKIKVMQMNLSVCIFFCSSTITISILYKSSIKITHSQYQMLQFIELDTFNEALERWRQTERNFINYNYFNYFVCCLSNWINAIMSPFETVDDQNKNVF